MVKPATEYRRKEIVDATLNAIDHMGLTRISYDLIAEEANTSRQLIRHHYPDSESLMMEISDYLANVYREMMGMSITEFDETQRMNLFWDFYFDLLSDPRFKKPRDDQYYDALFAIACRSDQLKQPLHDQYTSLRQFFANEVKISHPELEFAACDEIGHLFVSIMYGHWKMVANLGFSEKFNQVS